MWQIGKLIIFYSIDNAISRFEDQELDTARERIEYLFGDKPDEDDTAAEPQETAQQDTAIVEKARTMLDTVEEDDREDMIDLLETINDANKAGDTARYQEAIEELTELIFYIEN